MVRRHALLALSALMAGTGCHAGLSGNLAKTEPPVTREAVTVKRFVEMHNRNASAIRSMTAQPRIEVAGEGRRGRVNGLMAFERPRGFRLDLRASVGGQVADLGSNDKEFWFWVKDNKDKAIYVCDYKDVNSSQLAITYQPEWIVEALGLREIDPREAKTLAAKPGDKPGLLVLTQARRDNKGEMLTKETIVNETNGHIVEHRLWAGAKRDLLAKAVVAQYSEVTLNPTEEGPSAAKVQLPQKFHLEWVAEKFALDVTMGPVKINQEFAEEKRTALFTEPTIPGITRLDLARHSSQTANASKVYESMPSPRPGVRLGQPESLPTDGDGAIRTRGEQPQPPTADLSRTTAPPVGVIGAPIPRGDDPDTLQASATRQSWRPAILSR